MTSAQWLLASILAVPAATTTWLMLANWFGWRRTEESTARLVNTTFFVLTALSVVLCGAVVTRSIVQVDLSWFAVGHYRFAIGFVADWISAPLSALCALLCSTIGVFSRRYLHREPGYQRFYLLLSLFTSGVQVTVLAGSLDVVFIGWELVGLCSALLIAYFHERRRPVEHAIRAFFTYRFCDIGLLSAVVWVHHTAGSTSFAEDEPTGVFGILNPPHGAELTLIGLLVILAAIGKGGQAPFGGWLPRAMEGPTPSSAIFYGAISVHLAPFLLLRAAPILQASTMATCVVIAAGCITAIHATLVGRVQSDVKSVLAYASMTQVGLVFVEIGLGWYRLALIHVMGHACIRSLQILMSPNVLHDHQQRERGLGMPVPATGRHLQRIVPKPLQAWLYRHALERGYFDAVVRDFVVAPFVRTFRWLDSAERVFTNWVEGETHATPPKPPQGSQPHATQGVK